MNLFQQILFSLVSGYVVSEMFKLSYKDCLYVAFISAAIPIISWILGIKNTKNTPL